MGKNLDNFVGSNYLWIQNVFGSKYFWIQICFRLRLWLKTNIHVQNTFLTDSKQLQFFFENLFESKYFKHSCSKHIPDRFKTDSKNFGKYVWIKILFDPKCFWSQIFLNQISFIHKLWFTKHSCSKHIHDRFKTDEKNLDNFVESNYCWTQNVLGSKFFWTQICFRLKHWL